VSNDVEKIGALALTGATVYRDAHAEPIQHSAVLLLDGKIAAVERRDDIVIPKEARVVSCEGCTIVAGFWNTHVHFHERKWAGAESIPAPELERQLQDLTRYGFTSCFDLSSPLPNTQRLRERIASNEVAGPRIFSTGEGLIPKNGAPSAEVFRALGLMPTTLHEVADESQARGAVNELLVAGADAVKIFLSAPSGALAPATLRTAVERAHDADKPVFAHPNTASDVAAAIDAGVDVIAHTTPRSGAWDGALLESMIENGVALIPTLMLWDDLMRHDRASLREQLVTAAVEQLRAWTQIGGTVYFGTDLGAVKYDPTDEYRLMERAGMPFRQILASLTTLPANRFNESNNGGRVAAGNVADLVVLDGDPAQTPSALGSVRYTVRNGAVIYRG
jgi:imidazolonepropionase-like amidohydrolase